jgi:hypothetical protein
VTIASIGISKQNGSRLILLTIDKKRHEFILFCCIFLSFGNKIIFILEESAQFRYSSHIRQILYENDMEWCGVVQKVSVAVSCVHRLETSDSIIYGQFSE